MKLFNMMKAREYNLICIITLGGGGEDLLLHGLPLLSNQHTLTHTLLQNKSIID
jgi:hypothetical protein